MPGLTAWYGMVYYGAPAAGETVYVSASAGAVGSVAAQLAVDRGAQVIGSAGSQAKLDWLRAAGLSAVFNYRDQTVDAALGDLAPAGIDLYFDNVGGLHLQSAIDHMAFRGRIVSCGAVSVYNETVTSAGPNNLELLFGQELTIQGVRSRAHWDAFDEFLDDMVPRVRSGTLRYAETVYKGIERAPEAFVGLFSGENLGKMLLKLEHG
jgi:hypothetical protein